MSKHLPADASAATIASALMALKNGDRFTIADVEAHLPDWTVERTPRCQYVINGDGDAPITTSSIEEALEHLRGVTPEQIEAAIRLARTEARDYTELKSAIDRARKLLDQTEEWADAWHESQPGRPPFGMGGRYYGGDHLMNLALTAQTYHAAAEARADSSR